MLGSNQIMDHLIQQAGGYENIGFTPNDLYNYTIANRNNNMRDGDAECALPYLQEKADMDSSFFFNTLLMKKAVWLICFEQILKVT